MAKIFTKIKNEIYVHCLNFNIYTFFVDGHYRIEKGHQIQFELDRPYTGDILLAIVHTNQRFRTEIFESSQEKSSEEFIKYPIKVSGIYRDVTFDKSCSFSGTNVKAHGSIVSLDNETIIDMEFILNSWDCGKFPRDFTTITC